MSVPPTSPHRQQRSLSRRGVIAAAGAVAAGGALAPGVSAATGSEGTAEAAEGGTAAGTEKRDFPATRTAAATGTGETSTAFAAGYVAVRWSGAGDGVGIRLADGAWHPAGGGCAAVEDGGTALVASGGATSYTLRAGDGAGDLRSLAIDSARGPARSFTVPTEPTRVRGVEYLSRPAWGADEAKRYKDGVVNSPEAYYPFQTITVHHTDTPNDDADPAATVRAIYEYHAVTLDWGDIGYHFLIDESGAVYEGRYSGDDAVPAFDPEGRLVTAFHTSGFNSGNLGIALIGTLVDQGPTDAARASLVRLIRAVARRGGLDTTARTTYVNPVNGVTREVATVSGHRDWLETDCPGRTMYELLAAVRAEAAG
ncbi:peptidoglycan recognition protein family protein [Streptomyces sp. ACT015]|uniref:peptidoglycan recognition protein family protein n=1 Tax=Streptomyces sp. ACT015 TaxID=3134807 RepID=UPI003D16CFAA